MKKLMLIMALGAISVVSNAQYNSTMDNNVLLNERGVKDNNTAIELNTGSNNQEDPDMNRQDALNVNSMDAFEGYRNLPDAPAIKAKQLMINGSMWMNIKGQYQENRSLPNSKTKLNKSTVRTMYTIGTPPVNTIIWHYD